MGVKQRLRLGPACRDTVVGTVAALLTESVRSSCSSMVYWTVKDSFGLSFGVVMPRVMLRFKVLDAASVGPC